MSCLGALALCIQDDLPFIDGFFLSISAVTSTGLSTVAMADLSRGGFWILLFLIISGGSLILPMGPMLYRRYVYAKIKKTYPANLTIASNPVINEFDLQDRALGLMLRTICVYVFSWIVIGGCVLWGAMYLQPTEPELVERRFSRFSSAAFLSVSAFNNAGLSISSSSVEYHAENPLAYLALCLLIIAGNTMSPIFYRMIVYVEMRYRISFGWNVTAHRFILENPRRISVNTLPTREVIFLFITSTLLNAVQYIFYLGSCLDRTNLLELGHSRLDLAGMGFFQTISTRNAGLQIMNLRTMNQGMLLVYAIAMYLSGAPFVTALYASEDSAENAARDSTQVVDDDSDEEYDYEYVTDESDSDGGVNKSRSTKSGKRRVTAEEDSDSDESLDELNRVESMTLLDGDGCPISKHKTKTTTSTGGGEDEPGNRLSKKKKSFRKSQDRARTLSGGGEEVETLMLGEGQQRTSTTQLVETSAPALEEKKKEDVDMAQTSEEMAAPPFDVNSPEFTLNAVPVHEIAPSLEELILQAGFIDNKDLDKDKKAAEMPHSDYHELVRRNSAGLLKTLDTKVDTPDAAKLKRGGSTGNIHRFNKKGVANPTGNTFAGMLNLREPSMVKSGLNNPASKWSMVRQTSLEMLKGALFLEPDPASLVVKPLSPVFVQHTVMHGEDIIDIPKEILPDELAIIGKGKNSTEIDDGIRRRSAGKESAGSAKLLNIDGALVQPKPLISLEEANRASQHAFIRQSSAEVLNERKFEIRNRFVESFIMKHSFFIGVGVFICAFSEDEFMSNHPEIINLWYIIFEVVSAYGNVGLSLGEPGRSYSLVGSFGFIGKLTICAIMMLGKHRAMPKEKDAVIDFKCKRLRRAVNELGWQMKKDSPSKSGSNDKVEQAPGPDNNQDDGHATAEDKKEHTPTPTPRTKQSQAQWTGGILSPKVAPMPATIGKLEIDSGSGDKLDFLSADTRFESARVSTISPTTKKHKLGLVQAK